jgi:hypothetical protein
VSAVTNDKGADFWFLHGEAGGGALLDEGIIFPPNAPSYLKSHPLFSF